MPTCAHTRVYQDWWTNPRTRKEESFLRCPDCGETGHATTPDADPVTLRKAFEQRMTEMQNGG